MSEADRQAPQGHPLYEGGYVRLFRDKFWPLPVLTLELDNPQESLIKMVRVGIKYNELEYVMRRAIGQECTVQPDFFSLLIPHKFTVQEGTKLYHALAAVVAEIRDIDLETSIGLNAHGTVDEAGMFLHFVGSEMIN